MQKGVKPITFASFAGAVLVIAGTGWASKDWFLERWLVYRLRSTDIAVKVSAIEGLGRLGRCAAVPEIVEAGLWAKALWEPARKALLAMGLRAKPWLLEALKSQDPKARLLAAKALLEMPREGESPMPLLLWMLAEGDGAERLKSVEELGKRKSLPAEDAARAAPLMVDYVLRDGSAGAEEALVRFGAPAVMPLVQALTGPYYGCRSADLLGRIGPDAGPGVPVVVGILKALLLQAPERTEASMTITASVSKALGNLGPAALPALLEALENDDYRLRSLAANALETMGSAALPAFPALDRALEDQEVEVRLAAAAALLKIKGWTERVARVLREVPTMALRLTERNWCPIFLEANPDLRGCGPWLAKLLTGADEDRDLALRLLEGLKEPAPDMEGVVCVLTRQLEEEPLDLPAAEALWKLARPDWLPGRVIEIFEKSAFLEARRGAFELLSKIGPDAKAAVPRLIGILAEGTDLEETLGVSLAEIIVTLGTIGPEAKLAVPFLEEFLRKGRRSLRVVASWALQRIGYDPQALASFLADGGKYAKLTGGDGEDAALILGGLGPLATEALPALKEVLGAESQSVRYRSAWAIWKISGDAAAVVPVLAQMMEESNTVCVRSLPSRSFPEDQAVISDLLGEMGIPAVPELLRSLHHHRYQVRMAAARGLGALREKPPEVMQALRGALHDGHFRVAEAAREALAKASLAPAEVGNLEARTARGASEAEASKPLAALTQVGLVSPLREDIARAAIPGLTAAIGDPETRVDALRALARLGPEAADCAPALLQVLESAQDWPFRQEALECLKRIGPRIAPFVVQEVLELEESGEEPRIELWKLVQTMGPAGEKLIPLILKRLQDQVYGIGLAAIRCLAAIGPKARSAAPRLRELLQNPKESLEVILALRKAVRCIEGPPESHDP